MHFKAEEVFGSAFSFQVGSAPNVQYIASGGSDDWAKGEVGIKWVYLMELPDRGYFGFLLPRRYILPVGHSVLASLRAAAARISHTLAK